MNGLASRAVPALVVVALAINFVACGSPPGGPSAEPSRSAALRSPSTPTPELSTSSTVFAPAGVLKMGKRQAITLEGVGFTFTVPTADWVSNGSFGIDRSAAVGPEGAGFIPGRTPRSVSSPIHAPTAGMARYATGVGSTIGTWIVDVDGTTVWFDAETYEGAGPEPGQEIQAIVDSIEFE
jgi:hypothetical protein